MTTSPLLAPVLTAGAPAPVGPYSPGVRAGNLIFVSGQSGRDPATDRVAPDVETPVGTRARGEARNIFDGGGRYVSLLGGNGLFHHPDDRWPDAVDAERLAKLAQAFCALAVDLARE